MTEKNPGAEMPQNSPRETFKHLFTEGKLPADNVLQSIIPKLTSSELNDLALELAKEEMVIMSKGHHNSLKEIASGEEQSRRGFLSFAINTGLAGFSLSKLMTILTEEAPSKTQEETNSKKSSAKDLKQNEENKDNKTVVSEEKNWAWKEPVGETLKGVSWETFLGLLSTITTNSLIKSLGIPTGNTGVITAGLHTEPTREALEELIQKLEKDPKLPGRIFSHGTIIAPLVEEFFFRLAPALVLRLDSKNHWEVGIPAAVAFAAMHMVVPSKISKQGISIPGTDKTIETTYLPFPQFAFGLVLWHINQRYGYIPAVLAHGAANFPASIISSGTLGNVNNAIALRQAAHKTRMSELVG